MRSGSEPGRRTVRCAIYTRKSSDEGLEQSFNSLDAQREACAAYILSQASEGWTPVPEPYDDGGLSGGTLERPALQRLLADVAAGRIDIVVVYKVDRLTRSLLDFARLVEAFDRAEASFVSVTQSFNTTTSMGRLTLNMLLSFAQFEREVTAERIRDKIAASKARGMWMGGVAPLGYRPDGRSLAIVEEHAALVRHIFARYLELGCTRLLEGELRRAGIAVPERTTVSGRRIGGGWFSRGLLHVMLRRVTYDGQIAHRDKVYGGSHPAIIEHALFERVQAMLSEHTRGQRRTARARQPSLLAGRIVDAAGAALTATHANKAGANGSVTRYRYYVSRALHRKEADTGLRVPARAIEKLVAERIAALLDDPVELVATAWLEVVPEALAPLHRRAAQLAAKVRSLDRDTIIPLLSEVRVADDHVAVAVDTAKLARLLEVPGHADAPATLTLASTARLQRAGMAVRLVQANGTASDAAPQPALLRQLLLARRWWAELRHGELDVTRLAAREGVTASYLTRIVRLAFLAPDITDTLLAGTQQAQVDAGALTRTPLPACWKAQRAMMVARDAG